MSGWNGTGDEYIVDVESRYPLFSDMQTKDGLRHARSRENQYLNTIQGIPSRYPCRCSACPDRGDYPRSTPMRPVQAENDRFGCMMASLSDPNYRCGACNLCLDANYLRRNVNGYVSGNTMEHFGGYMTAISPEQTTMVLVFMFIIMVFIAVMGARALQDIKYQLKKLKKETT